METAGCRYLPFFAKASRKGIARAASAVFWQKPEAKAQGGQLAQLIGELVVQSANLARTALFPSFMFFTTGQDLCGGSAALLCCQTPVLFSDCWCNADMVQNLPFLWCWH